MDIDILFENKDVVVINKPAGLIVHEDDQSSDETVVGWFLSQFPEAKGVGEPGRSPKGKQLERSGVVHRLDRETSGVMVLAKNQNAFDYLKNQFHDRLVKKEYRALVYGSVREQWGTIDKAIGRSAQDFRKKSAEHGAKGNLREALTDWECIGTGRYKDEHFSYLRVLPKTGRTHQIRVHLKSIGRPVVFDSLYALNEIEKSSNLDLDRLALHAHKLQIELPSGDTEGFIAPVPLSIEAAVERIAE